MLEFHPLADIFPLMSGEQWTEFLGDIQTNGLREPIVVSNKLIVDGRNRYKAILELGITGEFVEWVDPGCGLKAWIISKNIHRRHLNAGQLGILTAKLEDFFKDGAKKRRAATQFTSMQKDKINGQPVGGDRDNAGTGKRTKRAVTALSEAAALTGASEKSAQDAKRLLTESPELAAKVEAGELKLGTAMRELDSPQVAAKLAAAKNGDQIAQAKSDTVNDYAIRQFWLTVNSSVKGIRKRFSMAEIFEGFNLKSEELDEMIEFLCDIRTMQDVPSEDNIITIEAKK